MIRGRNKEVIVMRRYHELLRFLLPYLACMPRNGIERRPPDTGDLIILESAPPSEWSLSFFVEYGKTLDQYVLESVQTGQLCNWSNVGLSIVDRKWVDDLPMLRWDDGMFAFRDKLRKAAKKLGLYMRIPFVEEFSEASATVGIRTRHGFDDHVTHFHVPDWRKITIKALSERLDAEVSRYNADSGASNDAR